MVSTVPLWGMSSPSSSFSRLDLPQPLAPWSAIRSPASTSKVTPWQTVRPPYRTATSRSSASRVPGRQGRGVTARASCRSRSRRSCRFSSTAASRRRWTALDRCISLAARWPTKPRSAVLAPVLSRPNLLFSVRSDQAEVLRADSSSRLMSRFSFSCRASSKASCRLRSSHQEEKSPRRTSMPVRLMARIWSTHRSRNARSWDTSRKPRFRDR